MAEPFPHHNAIVDEFWAANPDLKGRIFRTWYMHEDVTNQVNAMGKDAVALFVAKGAIRAAKKAASL